MSDQYTPMIERISEEYDESDSNMVLELAATNQEYADLKQQMSELKHQYPCLLYTSARKARMNCGEIPSACKPFPL